MLGHGEDKDDSEDSNDGEDSDNEACGIFSKQLAASRKRKPSGPPSLTSLGDGDVQLGASAPGSRGSRVVVPFDYAAAVERKNSLSEEIKGGRGASGSKSSGPSGGRGSRKPTDAERGRGRGSRGRGGRGEGDRSTSLLGSSPYDASGGIKMMRGGKRNALTPASGNRTSTFK